MTTTVPEIPLDAAREFIAEKFGLHFSPEGSQDLARLLARAAKAAGFSSPKAYHDLLLSDVMDERQLEVLVHTLTVGETYFFRDPKVWNLISENFAPQRISAHAGTGTRLRVWSAGCCTGEEAYTAAIMFDRMRALFPAGPPEILATDLNPRFLRQARAGIYRPWSFRNPPLWLQNGYFTRVSGDRFELRSDIRSRVKFATLNLVADKYPSLQSRTAGMDLILCRHVLMYFTPRQFSRVVHNLARCLVDGGWLIMSPAEVSHVDEPTLVPTRIGDITVHIKRARTEPAGDARHQRRDMRELETAPKWAQDSNPGQQSVMVELALSHHDSGRLLPEFPSVVPVGSGRGQTASDRLLATAHEFASQGKLSAALGACDRLLMSDKMNPVVHYLRSTILQEQGTHGEAERALKKVLYLDPAFIPAHVALASLARRGASVTEPLRHLRNARSLASKLSPASVIPESDGLTAGQIVHMISDLLEERKPATRQVTAGLRGTRPQRVAVHSISA